MVDTQRLIKKYSNRRLYDTKASSYVTLADLKHLIYEGDDFRVVDAQSGEDLTRCVLLQIIVEEEGAGTPMFSRDVLMSFIRLYGSAKQARMSAYLQQSIRAFLQSEETSPAAAHAAPQQLPMPAPDATPEEWASFIQAQAPAVQELIHAYMEHNKHLLEQMQQQFEAQNRSFFERLQGAGVVPARTSNEEAPAVAEAVPGAAPISVPDVPR